jgi:hypothetical protein
MDLMSFLKKDLFLVSNWNGTIFIHCSKVKNFDWLCDGKKKLMTIQCKAFQDVLMVFPK